METTHELSFHSKPRPESGDSLPLISSGPFSSKLPYNIKQRAYTNITGMHLASHPFTFIIIAIEAVFLFLDRIKIIVLKTTSPAIKKNEESHIRAIIGVMAGSSHH